MKTINAEKYFKEDQVEEPAKKTGVLHKYVSFFSGWQERLVEIDNQQLKYFKQTDNEKPVMEGTLNFSLYECILTEVPNQP